MNLRSLGASKLRVSELCLGTMSFGWVTDEATSHRMLDRYVDAGGNFIDTADIYAEGASEEIVGRWLKNRGRDELVVATKVRFATGPGPSQKGLGREHLLGAVEASLRRLNTEYIDLYQLHCWDAETPLEETLGAMESLVESGKIRYVGISNFTGWQLQKALDLCRFLGFQRVASFQGLYNLLDRFMEWDLLPVCRAEGVGLLCWSPLAGGWLTGLMRPGMDGPPPAGRFREAEEGGWSESWSNYDTEHTWRVLEEFLEMADGLGRSPPQVAINWLRTRGEVTAAILGAESLEQLEDSLLSLRWTLSPDQVEHLDAVSEQPVPRYPHRFINRFNT
ncbi:aldo/keto reductase [Gemmatimonadota bacterium]